MTHAHATKSSPSDPAVLSLEGPIATITLNRPDSYNAIDLAIAKKLEHLAAVVEKSDHVRVLVIQGSGKAFCAGGDIQVFVANADNITPAVREMLTHYHGFIAALRRMPKLVITSVHGSAAGAGLSLAFMGDFCIAADDARFTPAYAKLGVSPDGGGTVGLVTAAGPRRALQIFLGEDHVSAAQAHAWGLLTRIVPAAELGAATHELATRLAQNEPAAIAATKALVYRNAPPVEDQLHAEMDGIVGCMQTDTFRAAIDRFVKKK